MSFQSLADPRYAAKMAEVREAMRIKTDITALLKMVAEKDGPEWTPVLTFVSESIFHLFDHTTISPQDTVEGFASMATRESGWALIKSCSKGVVYDKLKARTEKYLEKHSVMGDTFNEFMYLFRYYYRSDVVVAGRYWEVVYSEVYNEPSLVCNVIKEPEHSDSYRDRVTRLAQSYGSKLEISRSTRTTITFLGMVASSPRGRILEDESLQDLVFEAETTARIPYRMEQENPCRGQGVIMLKKTSQFDTVAGDLPPCIKCVDTPSLTVLHYDIPEDASYKIKVGSSRLQKTLTFNGVQKGLKLVETYQTMVPNCIVSSDLNAEADHKNGILTIAHTARSKVYNLVRELPPAHLRLPLYHPSVSMELELGKGLLPPTEESMYVSVLAFLKMKPRTVVEVEMYLSLTDHPYVHSPGKYLLCIGADREEKDGHVLWLYPKRPDLVWTKLLAFSHPQMEMREKYGQLSKALDPEGWAHYVDSQSAVFSLLAPLLSMINVGQKDLLYGFVPEQTKQQPFCLTVSSPWYDLVSSGVMNKVLLLGDSWNAEAYLFQQIYLTNAASTLSIVLQDVRTYSSRREMLDQEGWSTLAPMIAYEHEFPLVYPSIPAQGTLYVLEVEVIK